jgi:hypothetical protein
MRFMLGLVGILLVVAAFGQTATELINKAITAHGGDKAVRQMAQSGLWGKEYRLNGVVIPLTIWQRGDWIRLDYQMEVGVATKVVTTDTAWQRFPGGDSVDATILEAGSIRESRRHTLKLLLDALQGLALTSVVVAEKLPDGRDAIRMDITAPKTSLWFDPSSGLVIGLSYRAYSDIARKEADLLSIFSDYKMVEGAQIPGIELQYVDGKQTVEIRTQSVLFQTSITDSIFARPNSIFKQVGSKTPRVDWPSVPAAPVFTGTYECLIDGKATDYSETFSRYKVTGGWAVKSIIQSHNYRLDTHDEVNGSFRPTLSVALRTLPSRTDGIEVTWRDINPRVRAFGEAEGTITLTLPSREYWLYSGAFASLFWPSPGSEGSTFSLTRFTFNTAAPGSLLGGWTSSLITYIGKETLVLPAGNFETVHYRQSTTDYWIDQSRRLVVKVQYSPALIYQLKTISGEKPPP